MVADEQERFLGWITLEDLKPKVSLREIIEPPTITADPSTQLNEALSMMLNSAIGNLAVTDDRERVIGVVSFRIIRQVLSEQVSGNQEERQTGSIDSGESQ
jgi:CBS domain-containing protein